MFTVSLLFFPLPSFYAIDRNGIIPHCLRKANVNDLPVLTSHDRGTSFFQGKFIWDSRIFHSRSPRDRTRKGDALREEVEREKLLRKGKLIRSWRFHSVGGNDCTGDRLGPFLIKYCANIYRERDIMVMYRDELNLAIYSGRYARARVRITQPFSIPRSRSWYETWL